MPESRGLMGEVVGVRTVFSMQAEVEACLVLEVEAAHVEAALRGPS